MPGPYFDKDKAAAFQKGFDPDSQILTALNSAVKQAGGAQAQPDAAQSAQPCPTCGQAPYQIDPVKQQDAESAKQAYMKANGVDENGDAVQK